MRIYRDTERHEIRDLNVSTALRGDFAAAHLAGDQASVLPTDTQKNTCFAYAKEHGVGEIEEYALALARHFVDRHRVGEPRPTSRSTSTGGSGSASPARSTRTRSSGPATRCARLPWSIDDARSTRSSLMGYFRDQGPGRAQVDRSEFTGFLKDRYTTLAETTDRILATSLTARWRYAAADVPWDEAFGQVRQILLERFATGAQPGAAADAVRDGRRPCSRPATTSPRSGCRRRTSITSWPTSRRSGWTIPARCSTPPTGPTG